jgi:hypothetical protein
MQASVDAVAAEAAVLIRRYLRSVSANLFAWRALREARSVWDIVWRSGVVSNTAEGLEAPLQSAEGAILRDLITLAKTETLVDKKGVPMPVTAVEADAALLGGWHDTRTYPLPPVADLYCGFSGEAARNAIERLRVDWELETAELGTGLFGAEPNYLQITMAALLRAKGPHHPICEEALVPMRPYILAHPAILEIYALFTLSVYNDFRSGALGSGTSLYANKALAAELATLDTATTLRRIFVAVVQEDITF